MRALLIEDDTIQRETRAELLFDHGHEVRACPCVALGLLELYAGWQPDVVLLDLMLPGCHDAPDGEAMLARLRADARWRELPVIVTTGTRGFAPGPHTSVLEKPFTVEALLEALNRVAPLVRSQE